MHFISDTGLENWGGRSLRSREEPADEQQAGVWLGSASARCVRSDHAGDIGSYECLSVGGSYTAGGGVWSLCTGTWEGDM